MSSYHRVEGPISKIISTSGLKKSEWLLGFRAITQKPLKFFTDKANRELFSEHDFKHGLEGEGKYLSNDYKSLFNLVTNHETWNGPTNLFKIFVVTFLLRCLQETDYFAESKHLGDDILYIGKDFLRHPFIHPSI